MQRKLGELLSGDKVAVTSKSRVLGQITDQSCLQVTRAVFAAKIPLVVPCGPRGVYSCNRQTVIVGMRA